MILLPVLVVAGGLAGWWFGYADPAPDVCHTGMFPWSCHAAPDAARSHEVAAPSNRGGGSGGDDEGSDGHHGNCPDNSHANSGRGNGSEGSPDHDPGNSGGHNHGGD